MWRGAVIVTGRCDHGDAVLPREVDDVLLEVRWIPEAAPAAVDDVGTVLNRVDDPLIAKEDRGVGGGVDRWASARLAAEGSSKGTEPVSISYMITPSA